MMTRGSVKEYAQALRELYPRGFRGTPAADIDSLADTLVRVSHLAVNLAGTLAELDSNPLMVLPGGQGVKTVVALAVLKG